MILCIITKKGGRRENPSFPLDFYYCKCYNMGKYIGI